MANQDRRYQDTSHKELKFFLKISNHQQSRPLQGAILIPPALLVVADSGVMYQKFCLRFCKSNMLTKFSSQLENWHIGCLYCFETNEILYYFNGHYSLHHF